MNSRSQQPSLKSNIAFNFLYQFLILVLPLITAPYLSRVVGAEGVGTYTYSNSIAMYFTYFVKLGLDNYGNREIARCGDDRALRSRTFWSLYCMQVICFVVVISAYAGYALFLSENLLVTMLQGIYVVSSLFDINWLFFGLEQFKLTVIRNTAIKVLATACIFLFVHDTGDTFTYITIMCLGYLASQLALWPYVGSFVDFCWPKVGEVVRHVRPNLTLFASTIVASLYGTMSRVLLGSLAGEAEVGYYDSAYKIIQVPIALVTAVGTVMLPRTSGLVGAGKKAEAAKFTERTLAVNMCFTCCAGFGLPLIAEAFTEFFYGSGFEQSARCMEVLSAVIPLFGFGNLIRTQYILPYAHDRLCVVSAACGAVVSIGLNAVLIPEFGALGAAYAYVAAELVVLLCQLFGIWKEIPVGRYLAVCAVSLCAGVVMNATLSEVWISHSVSIADILLEVLAGLVIYIPTCLILLLFMSLVLKRN